MRMRRSFTKEFKRQIVEEILCGASTIAAVCRQYSIAYPVVSRWKKDYTMGRLDNEPTTEAGYQEKIAKLERKVGQLTMENDFLKKVSQQVRSQQNKSASIYPIIVPGKEASNRGAES